MNTPTADTQSPQQAASPDPIPGREQIAERAYYLYLDRGRADGSALQDWLTAEQEIRRQRTTPAVS
jgi:hypothetical protein